MPMSVDHAEDTLYNALKLDPANALTYRRLAGLYARNGTYWSWLPGAPVVHAAISGVVPSAERSGSAP